MWRPSPPLSLSEHARNVIRNNYLGFGHFSRSCGASDKAKGDEGGKKGGKDKKGRKDKKRRKGERDKESKKKEKG